ncbi:WD40 repeat-like protein [Imleria badia]|nr:WD40 repeat-like protein [Imleria badia]
MGGGNSMLSLIFLACGKRVATLCERDHKIRLWSADNDQLKEIHPPMEHGPVVNALVASKDGKWIVSGDDDGVVMIWDAMTHPIQKAGEFKTTKGDGRKITALDISPDSSRVVVGSGNGSMVVWRIETRERILGPLQYQNSSPISSVKFSPAGGRIASGHLAVGGGDCSIRLWHSHTGAQLESIRNPRSTYSLAWSVDGHRLFAGGPDGSVKCFNVLTRTLVEWRAPSIRDLITFLCVSNNGQFLVSVSSGRTGAIDIWNISVIPPFKPLRSRNEVVVASVSPDDTRLITVGRDNDIASWNLSALIDETYLLHHLSLSATHSSPVSAPAP